MAKVRMAFLFLLLATTCSALDFHQTLDDKYDPTHVDLEEVAGILNCLSDAGQEASFRKNYPEIIIEACSRCTPTQKMSLCLFMKRAVRDLPEDFRMFRSQHDPQNLHFD